jgi:hypothetical protein
MKNSTFQKIGGIFMFLMISLIVSTQDFHFREGFNYKPVITANAEDSVPAGWTTYDTYASKINHGLYITPGEENDRSIRLKDGGSWIATKPVDKAGVFKAWVQINPEGDGTEVIHISKHITGGDSTLLATVDTSVLDTAWVELSFDINDDSDGIFVKITRDISSNGGSDIYVDDVSITVFEVTGINSFAHAGYNLYPNPVEDVLNIDFQGSQNRYTTICDITGRIIWTGFLRELNNRINMSQYFRGIYLISIRDSDGIYTDRFIKR